MAGHLGRAATQQVLELQALLPLVHSSLAPPFFSGEVVSVLHYSSRLLSVETVVVVPSSFRAPLLPRPPAPRAPLSLPTAPPICTVATVSPSFGLASSFCVFVKCLRVRPFFYFTLPSSSLASCAYPRFLTNFPRYPVAAALQRGVPARQEVSSIVRKSRLRLFPQKTTRNGIYESHGSIVGPTLKRAFLRKPHSGR